MGIDIAAIGMDQIADIAFFMLIAGIGFRTFFVDRDAPNKQRAVWKEEFRGIEATLRNLINEATQASEVFDRKLERKHRQITTLIEEVEIKIAGHVTETMRALDVTSEKQVVNNNPQQISELELPATLADITKPKIVASTSNISKDGSMLEETSISNNNLELTAIKESLDDDLDFDLRFDRPMLSDHQIFQQTSIVDLSAFKIAKRLLLEGKELHVVARKIDLPVSEVRHLDMLLREQAEINDPTSEYIQKEKRVSGVKKVIRDKTKKVEDLESQIRRSLQTEKKSSSNKGGDHIERALERHESRNRSSLGIGSAV